MSIAKKIEELLKDELRPENIKTVIDLTEYLKFKEGQSIWCKINESEKEYISEEERKHLDELKSSSELHHVEKFTKNNNFYYYYTI